MNNKKPKNKFLYLTIACLLLVSTFLFSKLQTRAEFTQKQTTKQEAVSSKKTVKDFQSIPEKNISSLKNVQKDGTENPLLRFFIAMAGVLISVLSIFFGLKLYKRFVLKRSDSTNEVDYQNSLESPTTFKDAISLFLNKTDK